MGTPTPDREVPGGLLLVDKPAGVTSHDVVAIVRRAAHTRRVGHAGTLDPFATGLLVVLVGRGTRLIPYVEGEPKVYDATIRFGAETDTDDLTGSVVRAAPPPTDTSIAEGIARLTGTIDQVPPAFSAKQVGGRRAYAAARSGAPLELAPAAIVVNEWRVLGRDGPDLRVRIACGSGTYVRALARDLGRYAGSAAHLIALRRVKSGPFDVADAVPVDAIQRGEIPLAPLRAAIPSLAVRLLDASELARVGHGNSIDASSQPSSAAAADASVGAAGASASVVTRVALVDDSGDLVAVAERDGAQLRPKLVLRDG